MTVSATSRYHGTIAAVVLAAGEGRRFGTTVDKCYALLGGKPVLHHALSSMLAVEEIGAVLPVVNPNHRQQYRSVLADIDDARVLPPIAGGATRCASVLAALRWLARLEEARPEVVLIHDAARPMVSAAMVRRVIAATVQHGAAVPVLAIVDAIKRIGSDSCIIASEDRGSLRCAQTPQGFHFAELLAAHESYHQPTNNELSPPTHDDAHLLTQSGRSVTTIAGEMQAIKITTPDDIAKLETLLMVQSAQHPVAADCPSLPYRGAEAALEYRSASGYDVHRLQQEAHGTMVLGGHSMQCGSVLIGHSDADVLLHAITDAILGLCHAGDIGTLFPPSDSQWQGADSAIFVNEALTRLARAGGKLTFVDATVICEQPKIAPVREAIIAAIASRCALPKERVSLKATTSERLGFTGRGEGIAAMATVSGAFAAPRDHAITPASQGAQS